MCWRLWLGTTGRRLAFRCLGARFNDVLFLGVFDSCYEVSFLSNCENPMTRRNPNGVEKIGAKCSICVGRLTTVCQKGLQA
jgi:hypothetical protein